MAGDVVGSELCDDAVSDLIEALSSQGQDGWSSAGQANSQQTGLRGGGHELENLCQTGNQGLAVRLVHLVLHGKEDHIRIWWGTAQGCGEEGRALEVENLTRN